MRTPPPPRRSPQAPCQWAAAYAQAERRRVCDPPRPQYVCEWINGGYTPRPASFSRVSEPFAALWLHNTAEKSPQTPSNRRRLPSNRRRLPSNRRQLPSNRRRLPSNRRRSPSNERPQKAQSLRILAANGPKPGTGHILRTPTMVHRGSPI